VPPFQLHHGESVSHYRVLRHSELEGGAEFSAAPVLAWRPHGRGGVIEVQICGIEQRPLLQFLPREHREAPGA